MIRQQLKALLLAALFITGAQPLLGSACQRMREQQSDAVKPTPLECQGYAIRYAEDNSGAALVAIKEPSGRVSALRFDPATGQLDASTQPPLGVTAATLTREGDQACAQTQGSADACIVALKGQLCATVKPKP